MTPLELIKRAELQFADLGESQVIAGVSDVDEVTDIVAALEQFRRSSTVVIEMWRERQVEVVKAAGGRTDLGIGATASVRPKLEERYDHQLIGHHVILHATKIIEDGEVLREIDDPVVAADRAVGLMLDLYVSPATKPKKTALDKVGFETYKGALKSSTKVGEAVKVRAK